MGTRYILDTDGNPVEEPDIVKWREWYKNPDQSIARNSIVRAMGDVRISTVFLGIDHSSGDGPPRLFETMIFGGQYDQYRSRYATKAEALAGHNQAVVLARSKNRDEKVGDPPSTSEGDLL